MVNPLFFLQIIFESFPISSSGHLLLFSSLFAAGPGLDTISELFAHVPTLFILIIFFYKNIKNFFIFYDWPRIIHDIFVIGLATGITASGYLFFQILKNNALINVPLWYGFLFTGMCLLSLRTYGLNGQREYLTLRDGVFLGLIQVLSLLPGISRFASTLAIALLLGLEKRYAYYVSCALCGAICLASVFGTILYKIVFGAQLLFSLKSFALLILSTFISYICFFVITQMYLYNMFWMIGLYEIIIALFAFLYLA